MILIAQALDLVWKTIGKVPKFTDRGAHCDRSPIRGHSVREAIAVSDHDGKYDPRSPQSAHPAPLDVYHARTISPAEQ